MINAATSVVQYERKRLFMKRLAWCTDIHLDSCKNPDASAIKLMEVVKSKGVEGLILTGDISNSQNLVYHLSVMERVLQKPLLYVVGNHDFWGSRIELVQKQMNDVSGMAPYLRWLPSTSYVPLTDSTCIVGHDGWYDCMEGDPFNTPFQMNDWTNIHDFREAGGPANRGAIVALCRKLSHAATTSVQTAIRGAVRYHSVIVVATHVPPFSVVVRSPDGKVDPSGLPWYTSTLMGSMLRQAAAAFPKTQFIVLSGHTHSKCSAKIADNMVCHVAAADYGRPAIADVLDLP